MILEKVKKTISSYHLLQKKDKILIAYSGGVDSTALLHLLLELRREWSLELFLAHFNHKLRQSSEEDEQFVRRLARSLSLPLIIGSRDVRSHARQERMNIEEAGRELRYDFLKKTAQEVGADRIATGHTMTDQAETFLIRLLRGSGLRGLAGIFPEIEGMIIRPLIQVEREEIEAYLKEKGVEFRIDETNFDRRLVRNRIRLDLIPYLKENFEPRIILHLSRLASLVREDDNFLESTAREKARLAISCEDGHLSLDFNYLSSLPLGLARRVAREFILRLRGDLRGVSFRDVDSILNIGAGKEFLLRKGMILRREGGRLFLKEKAPARIGYEYIWNGQEPLEIKELGLKFEGKRVRRDDSCLGFDDHKRALLDLKKLKFPLLVRNRLEGDRYQPLGAPGRKKLKEMMRARRLPLSQRGKKPVFLSGADIVWVLDFPVSERFKINEKTSTIFVIERL